MKLLIKLKSMGLLAMLMTFLLMHLPGRAAGLLTPTVEHLESLELSEHHVDLMIENGYSTTTVTQTFFNPHNKDLEAIYSFPVPKHASVSEFSLWIDGKQEMAEVLEKQHAKKIYQQEKQMGNDVGLTEKNGYKTFEIRVSPVRAGKHTKIELRYYQLDEVDLGIGRWVYQLEDGGVDSEALSFWNTNSTVSKHFSFNAIIRSSYPIDAVRLPNHGQAIVKQISSSEWHISLEKKGKTSISPLHNSDEELEDIQAVYLQSHPEKESKIENEEDIEGNSKTATHLSNKNQGGEFRLNKDIVVYWKHQQGLPGSIDLVSYRENEQKKGTFMMTFTPGEELSSITQGRDWNFILDISGSMQGKFSTLVEGISQSIRKMNVHDRVRIILFNSSAYELTQGYENATPENIQSILSQLKQVSPDQGTNLYAGLKLGIGSLDSDRATGIVLVTDGVANVGNTEKKHFFKLLEKQDIRLFTFVMGNSANQPLLEPLAKHTGGFSLNISNADDIVGRVLQATQKLTHEAFHDVEVLIDGVEVSDLTPKNVGSLYRGQQLIVMGHYWKGGEAKVTLKTKVSGQQRNFTTQVVFPQTDALKPELERLWAYAKINDLSERMRDFANEDHQQAITDIALKYGIVTDYTSMLVMREEQFEAYNIKRHNKERVKREELARQKRKSLPKKSTRADNKQPAFQSTRPTSNGGGSLGWMLILLLGGIIVKRSYI